MKLTLIPDIIRRTAERRPDAEAFRCDGAAITCAALHERAGRLAGLLADAGVRPGDRVGILLPKSLEIATAVYGVMTAGAAYVPLDPRAPAARISAVIEDAGIEVVVTATTSGALPPSVAGAAPRRPRAVVLLDVDDATIPGVYGLEYYTSVDVASRPPLECTGGLTENALAYIMYTSGSTGTPKGIMHTHRSGLAYARAAADLYGLDPSDRLGNHSPLHFDMSTFDYFAGPLAGATTVIIPEAYSVMPASMSTLVQDERLTIWYSVPLALIQMLTGGILHQRDLASVRWVLFGGEPFPPKHLKALMCALPGARFSNVYGPAEVNQCTFFNVPPDYATSDTLEPVPLGGMWPAARGLVIDKADREVGPGVDGELCVATETMMLGYWNRDDLNEHAFLHREENGSRVRYYRTGDVVRKRADGLMEFVGRSDRQVKVRGYRVELDEIERALTAHPGVREAAVFSVDTSDGKEIRAAVIASVDELPTVPVLRAFLSNTLPRYAMPSRIDLVDSFPRTGTGKVDRRRLQTASSRNGELAA